MRTPLVLWVNTVTTWTTPTCSNVTKHTYSPMIVFHAYNLYTYILSIRYTNIAFIAVCPQNRLTLR